MGCEKGRLDEKLNCGGGRGEGKRDARAAALLSKAGGAWDRFGQNPLVGWGRGKTMVPEQAGTLTTILLPFGRPAITSRKVGGTS